MNIAQFDGTIAYFVISRLAGGEILENYVKHTDLLQPLLEYSLSYIENFESYKNDIVSINANISDPSLKIDNLRAIEFIYSNMKVFLSEIKESDIFVVAFFNSGYPDGIIKIILNDYINHVRQNYSL
ncbi:MAG: hypothetical protein RMJ51_03590 [Candidatus Calescibacterium sp.]|nr:hypothetical protein [Candidatus Calescibacterium sp.]MCX7971702.1 hypothetical protein [bacterium]MDW8195308.1 hypothetical protein [Candidatus Calescibacterium sp.]